VRNELTAPAGPDAIAHGLTVRPLPEIEGSFYWRALRGFTDLCWQVTLRSKQRCSPGGPGLGWHLEMLVAAGLGLIERIRITVGEAG